MEDFERDEQGKALQGEDPLEQVHPSYELIPKFFDPPCQSNDKMQQLLRMEARGIELQAKAKELLDFEELEKLWRTLEEHVTERTRNNQMLIDLGSYLDVVYGLGVKFREFINVRLFFDLMDESEFEERLNIVSIYNHTLRQIRHARACICLCYYDQVGLGYLRESELESYVADMKPLWSEFYVCTVVKTLFFFLDTLHTGRVRISEIESSELLSKIMELNGRDGEENCLSIVEVYETYLWLDKDHNGLLSKTELSAYGSGLLTNFFLDRAFEVCHTFGGEINYKTFLEFFLALEFRNTLAGLRYIFRILDINQQGYLTAETLFYFYTETQGGSKALYKYPDLKDKIFDMARPRDTLKITLRDLINCGQGGAVVSLIIQFQKHGGIKDPESAGFFKYLHFNEQPQTEILAVTTLSQI